MFSHMSDGRRFWDRATVAAVAFMVMAQVFSFRLFIRDTGFYHDDWVTLVQIPTGSGLWTMLKTLAGYQQLWARPVQIPLLAGILSLTGLEAHPARAQAIMFLLEALESVLFFVLLFRLTRSKRFAFLGAFFMSVLPNRAVMHFWLSNYPQSVSHVLVLAGLLLHLDWMEDSRKRLKLFFGQVCYVAGVLSYESTIFMPALLLGAFVAGSGINKKRDLVKQALGPMLPFAVSFFIALLWQRGGAQIFLGAAEHKSIALSAGYILKAFGAGFECVTNRVAHISALSLAPAWKNLSWGYWFAWLCLVAGIFRGAAIVFPSEKAPDYRRVAGICLGGFLGAYAPFALSGVYIPQIFGIMSRTNGVGAWMGGILLGGLFDAWMRSWHQRGMYMRFMPAAFASVVAGAFFWTNAHAAWEYSGSWKIQQDVLAKLSKHAAHLPSGSTILLEGVPRHFGKAVIFDATYDFDYALKLTLGRRDILGRLYSPNVRSEKDAFVVVDFGEEMRFPFKNLFLYDYAKEKFHPIRPSLKTAIP